MRIVHVIESLDPSNGGPPKIAACIAAGQAALGHDVRLVSMSEPERMDDIQTMLDSIPGISAVDNKVLKPISAIQQVLFKVAGKELSESIQWSDIVHVHNVWSPINIPACNQSRKYNKPYLILLNGMLDPWSLSQSSLKKALFLKLRYRDILNHAAALHLGNTDEEKLIKPLGLKSRGVIIPNGVYADEISRPETLDQVYSRFPILSNRPFMLFMGRIHYKKGLDVTVEAFADFAKTNGTVQLVIAGPEGGAEDDILARIKKHGLEERIHMVGSVYGNLKWQLLHAAECFVLTTRQEGFSVAVTEALGCGLPCIVSEDCHYPIISQIDAGFVIPLEHHAVVKAMRDMFESEQLRQQMSLNARELVLDRFTWPKVAQRCVEVYGDLI